MNETPGERPPSDPPGAPPGSADGVSFEQRLRTARVRRGLDKPDSATSGTSTAGPWGVGVRAGVEMLSSLVVALAIGWGLDKWLHTMPLFVCVFVFLGGAAGILNVWRMFAPRNTAAGETTRIDGKPGNGKP